MVVTKTVCVVSTPLRLIGSVEQIGSADVLNQTFEILLADAFLVMEVGSQSIEVKLAKGSKIIGTVASPVTFRQESGDEVS